MFRTLIPALGRTFRGLRHPNFRLFFFGQLVSLIGSWMQMLAQGWLVWRLTESPWWLGVVGFAQMGPVFFLGVWGGVAADRFDRHKMVIATQVVALTQAVTLATLTILGTITVWQIVVLAGLLGVVNAFDFPCRHAFLVAMVGKDDLANAIALNSTIFNGARMVGPSLAGLVVAAWGEGVCFAINAVSFLAVLASLLAMRFDRRPVPDVPPPGVWQGLREGFSYAWTNRTIRALLFLMAAVSFFGLSYMSLLPAFVGGILHSGPRGLGVLMGSVGLGALFGAGTMAYRSGTSGLFSLAGTRAAGLGVAVTIFGLAQSLITASFVAALAGYCAMVQMAATNTCLQTLVPERLRGRLMSFYTVVFAGLMPFGSLVLGRLSLIWSLRPVLLTAGLATLASGVLFTLRPGRKKRN